MKKLTKIFYDRLKLIYSSEENDEIIKAISQSRNITTFRINYLKSNKKEVESFLQNNSINFENLKNFENIYIVDKKHEYFLKWSEIFYSGKIYIQGISSMLPAIVLNPKQWEKILDMTAAPGSKTTQIAMMINNSWEIIAIEQNQIRFDKLNYNIKLQWVTCVETIKSDANKLVEKLDKNSFDEILLDAPCSAEGRINLENEKTYWFWSLENIKKKQAEQLKLLQIAVNLVKKWGEIVYSTCTLAPEENEEVIDKILQSNSDIKLIDFELNLDWIKNWIEQFWEKTFSKDIKKTKRILPTNLNEWFYIAKLKKN